MFLQAIGYNYLAGHTEGTPHGKRHSAFVMETYCYLLGGPKTMDGYLTPSRVTIPDFQLVSSPTFRISEIKRRRFNVIDRYQSVTPRNPWTYIYGDILKRKYEVEVLSIDADGTYHIDVAGMLYKLEPGKQPVEE